MSQSLRYITWSTLFVVLAATGCAEISKKLGWRTDGEIKISFCEKA